MHLRKLTRWFLPVVTVLAAVRCGSDGLTLPPEGLPAFIQSLGGDSQSGVVGQPLPDTLMVRITDSKDRPVKDQKILFELIAGGTGAVLIPDTAVTDADGQAKSRWILGHLAGQQKVRARVLADGSAGGLHWDFIGTAAADAPDTVVAVKGTNQQGIVGTPLADSLAVAVTDQFGNPIPGQTVNWTVPPGQGTVSAATTTTGPDGRSAVLRTLGPTSGIQTATATWPGHTPVVFSAQAGASGVNRLVKLFGDNQTAPAGQKLTDSIVVQAQDQNGNGVAGQSIGWTVVGGGGSISAASGTTDAQGKAFVFWTLGTTAGPNAVQALRIGVPVVQFNATGSASQPTKIAGNSTLTLSGTAGQPVSPAPSVKVTDVNNNGVQGVTVRFTVATGGGTVSDGTSSSATVTVATNASGVATLSSWTLGPAAGTNNNSVVADVPSIPGLTGSPITFTASAAVGGAARLAFIQQPTNVAAGAVITPFVTVQVQDANGNPIPNATNLVTVAFGTNPGSGILNGTKSVNAVNGLATFSTLSVDKVGTGYTLVTTGSGLLNGTSTAFNVTAGTPFKLVFVQQPTNAGAGAVIAPPITVQVQDANSNPITTSTASISMAIGTNPGGSALTGTTPVAAVGGLATFSNLSLNKAGTGYTLVASSGTLQPATSTAFNVGAGVATQLVFSTQPSNTVAGSVMAPAVQVAVRDAQGNTITGDTRTITVAIGTNPGAGTLSGTLSQAAVNGVATFANLSINALGTGYTLTANDGALPQATSAAFNISVGNGNKLGFIGQPSTVVTGAPITPAVRVAVQDAGGNTVTTATDQITIFLAGGSGLAGTMSVAAVAGVATFTNLNVTQAGAGRTLNATSPNLISATSTAFTINPAATTTTITNDTPDPSAVGQAYTVNYTVAVTAPGTGTPTGNVTVSDGVSTCTAAVGTGSCSLASTSTGAKTLTATYTGDANYAASVSAGAAHTVNAAPTVTTITGDAPDPSVVGQPYTITVSITSGGGTPAGTVNVSDGAATCPITLVSGSGSCNLTSTTTGTKTITATYAAQGNFLGSSGTMSHVVNAAPTTTAIISDTPDPSTVGQAYAVAYAVTVNAPGAGTPTGNVTVSDGSVSCSGTVAAGTCNITSTSGGAKTLTATYSGDANFATSVSAGAAHTVGGAATTTTITADTPDPTVVGQPYAVTVTVTSTGGTPTGTVSVSDGAATCPITLAAGTGSCNLTSTTVGAKSLVASYAGSGSFAASTSPAAAHQVNQAATTATVTGDSPDPSVVNNAYNVTFTVAANAPGAGTPTGNVTVSDGAGATCTATVAVGNCNVTSTTTGNKTLTATYGGDANFAASPASAGVVHGVNASGTTVAITQDTPDPSVVGQAVTVNFTVTGAAPVPTGTVTVLDGAVTFCSGTLAAGVGSCSAAFTTAGTKSLTASYGGDATHGASSSPSIQHVVNAAATTTAITAHTPNPSVVGTPIAVTVSVTPTAPGAGTPTGSVVVSDGTASCLASVAVPTCNLTPITTGAKTLTAQYAGDANFMTSTSAGAAHQVDPAPTGITTTDTPDPSVTGQVVPIGFTVTGGVSTPTGTVNVTDGTRSCSGPLTSGAGSCSLTYPGAGSWNITATYLGDALHAGSTSVANAHGVGKATTTTTIGLVSPAATAVGEAYTVNYAVAVTAPGAGAPTGNVTVSDGVATCQAVATAGSCSLISTTAGGKTLVATYAGDANFLNSASTGVAHTVGAAATVTTITADPTDPSVVGQAYPVTVSVTSTGGTPTGSVTIADGSGGTCPVTLAAGTGSCNLTSTSPGAKTLTATYAATADFATSSGTMGHQVNQAATTTTITADTPDPSAVGAAVQVNYAVAVVGPGAGTPTGNVTVSDGVNSCTGTVAAGQCSVALATLGARTLTATYAGDANFTTSNGTTGHTVNLGATTTTITSDTPEPSVVGQGIVVNFTVTGGVTTPTGNVTVSDGGASCIGTVAAGTCTLTATTAGAKTLVATYAGDGSHAGSTSVGAPHQVNAASTTTTITADTPDPSGIGASVQVNYTVAVSAPGTGTPTGNVTVSDGVNSCTGTVAAGQCSVALLTLGARTLTATYAGDGNFATSNGTTAHTVSVSTTTTTITSDTPDPSVVGQGVVVNFTVTGGVTTPTGNVTVSDGNVSCVGTVAAGTCTLTPATAGAKTLVATYEGDGSHGGGTSTGAPHQVNAASTTTTITQDTPDPSTVGVAFTPHYTVTANAPGTGTPTGNVTVSDGVNNCTGTVAAGQCDLTLSTLGARTLTATYSTDGNFAGSTSAGVGHTVATAATTTTITNDPTDPSVVGQGYAVTVSVSSTSGTPTGNVTVSDGSASCPITLASGTGTCTLTSTTAGTKTLTATYAATGNFAGSSGTTGHQVNAAGTTTTITQDTPDPSTVGVAFTLHYTVAANAPGSGTPTGNVTVSDGVNSCTGTVAAGQCDLTLNTVGGRTLTATYGTDGNFAGSTSVGVAHTVSAITTSTAVGSSGNPSTFGQSVTFTATVTSGQGTPTGFVQFVVDGSNFGSQVALSGGGQATTSTSALAAGGHTVTANYLGQGNFAASSGSLAGGQTVNQAASTTSISSSANPSVFGQSVTFTATVSSTAPGTPGGTVQFVVDGSNFGSAVTLSGGQASISTSGLAVGGHSVSVNHGASGNYGGSSGTLSGGQTVDQANTTTTITGHDEGTVDGTPITVTFTVAPVAPGAGTPTGNVTVTESSGTGTCTASVAVGSCSFTPTSAGVGVAITLTATYEGNTSFNGSSGNASHTVN